MASVTGDGWNCVVSKGEAPERGGNRSKAWSSMNHRGQYRSSMKHRGCSMSSMKHRGHCRSSMNHWSHVGHGAERTSGGRVGAVGALVTKHVAEGVGQVAPVAGEGRDCVVSVEASERRGNRS